MCTGVIELPVATEILESHAMDDKEKTIWCGYYNKMSMEAQTEY